MNTKRESILKTNSSSNILKDSRVSKRESIKGPTLKTQTKKEIINNENNYKYYSINDIDIYFMIKINSINGLEYLKTQKNEKYKDIVDETKEDVYINLTLYSSGYELCTSQPVLFKNYKEEKEQKWVFL
jgi:hypothetical protein